MNKQNLVVIAEGLQLIAGALLAEAGATTNAVSPKAEKAIAEAVEAVETAVSIPVADEVTETEGYTEAELKAMTVADLKEIADEAGITYGSKPKKADLVDAILEAQEEADEEEADVDTDEEAVEADEETDSDVEADDEEVDADDEAGDDEEELTAEDLDEMSLAELKELSDEYEIEYPKAVKAPALREILIEELFTDEDEEASDEGDEEELTVDDLEEMSLSELKELADEYEVSYPKAVKAPKLREILVAELFADEDEEGEEEADTDSDDDSTETDLDETDYAEELGLNDMDVEELAEILTEHGLSTKGKKQALVARIVEAIEDGTIEIEDEEEGE